MKMTWKFWKRKFDSSTQKSRGPIRDREKFDKLHIEFTMTYGDFMRSLMKSNPDLDAARKALQIADEMIEIEPQRAIPWTSRCLALGALGRYSEALDANNHAIEIDPSDPDKWDLQANILRTLGKMAEAGEAAKMAAEMRQV